MEKRTLGRTGLPVTVLGYGAMALDQQRMAPRGLTISDDLSGQVLNAVLDAGINFIDTAPDYGTSEDLIGRYIASRRGEYFLASKCGCLVSPDAVAAGQGHVYTPENIRAGVEQSLVRMHTDYLDLVQFHGNPSPQDVDAAITTLEDLRREGKVRFIGSSSTLPSLNDLIETGRMDAFQVPFSVVQIEHDDAIADAANAGAGVVIRGGVARGAPSDDKDWAQRLPEASTPDLKDAWDEANLDELLDGMSRIEFTLRFTITHPGMHTTIVGTGNLDHLRGNIATAEKGPLPADLYQEARRRLHAAQAQ